MNSTLYRLLILALTLCLVACAGGTSTNSADQSDATVPPDNSTGDTNPSADLDSAESEDAAADTLTDEVLDTLTDEVLDSLTDEVLDALTDAVLDTLQDLNSGDNSDSQIPDETLDPDTFETDQISIDLASDSDDAELTDLADTADVADDVLQFPDADGKKPTILRIVPGDGRHLGPRQRIMIWFDESMDPGSLKLGGGIGSNAKASWFTTVNADDTLILEPITADWGAALTLIIDARDLSGEALASASFAYVGFPQDLPLIKVPIQAFRVSDDDGSRTTAITPQQVATWVAKANQIYGVAAISFLFDPNDSADFIDIDNTLINQMVGTGDAQWVAERDAANLEAGKHTEDVDKVTLNKLALFFRYGPGQSPTGGGFSWTNYNFVAMPGFNNTGVCGHQNIQLLAHEIGHYLGLAHTFGGSWATIQLAEKRLSDNNADPFVAFDGDKLHDTLPDPWISSLNQCDATKMHLALNGEPFLLPRNNIMSYYDSDEMTLSLTQLWTVRQGALVRTGQSVAAVIGGAVTLYEGESQKDAADASKTGGSIGLQNMRGFLGNWSGDTQLFWGSPGLSDTITFTINAPTAGKQYEIYVGVTQAPDFGTFELALNGALVGTFDGYATRVKQSIPWLLGSVQLDTGKTALVVRFKRISQNPASSGSHLGLDYILLREK